MSNKWNTLSMRNKAELIKLGVQNGLRNLDDIIEAYNSYADGGELGVPDTWKPWYWGKKKYDTSTLKEAIEQAYDEGKRGDTIIWNGRAYRALLDDRDERAYNNKKITNEQVVDSYIDNVLYTMENPKNAGYKKGKYYPYEDVSSKKNIGPGINYTSNIGRGIDFSGNTGYTREELNEKVRPDLIHKMEQITNDLHDMYGDQVDTMSIGNRMILLDISHQVRPRGKKRGNMPKAWPKLVQGMMEGNTESSISHMDSGSTRRRDMRSDLLWKQEVDGNTVRNR